MNKTCTDCINHDLCICKTQQPVCRFFEDKSRYIELPCAVGDVVWDKNGEPHKVISIEWYSSKVMHLHCEHRTFSVGKRSIGKTVFLTEEEAEQALRKEDAGNENLRNL